MTAVIHRGDGNGRSPFQVSVGVVRLRRLVVDGTRGLTSLSLSLSLSLYIYPLVLLAKVSGRLSSSGVGGTLLWGCGGVFWLTCDGWSDY